MKKNSAEEGAGEQLFCRAVMEASPRAAQSLFPASAIWGAGLASLVYACLARSLSDQPSLFLQHVYFDLQSREVWASLCCSRRPAALFTQYTLALAEETKHTHITPRRPRPLPFPRPEHKRSVVFVSEGRVGAFPEGPANV